MSESTPQEPVNAQALESGHAMQPIPPITGKQLDMFDGDEKARALFLEIQEDGPRNPNFTGERFRVLYPGKYAEVVRLHSEGLSTNRIADILCVSRNTVSAVLRKLQGDAGVEQAKRDHAVRWRHVARLTLERQEEILLSTNPDTELLKAVSLAGAVAEDKAELLSGGATARVEYREPATRSRDEIGDLLASLPSAQVVGETQFKAEEKNPMGLDAAGKPLDQSVPPSKSEISGDS